MNQPGARRHGITMRLRELLPLRTLAAGTVPVANHMLVATFLNFHRGLLLGHYPDKITSFHASQLVFRPRT
jgi:hypothetical protein